MKSNRIGVACLVISGMVAVGLINMVCGPSDYGLMWDGAMVMMFTVEIWKVGCLGEASRCGVNCLFKSRKETSTEAGVFLDVFKWKMR
jgi:hypothetical protein